jgi:protocatechuate 3,4-dioxygenase beta subunit
MVHTIVMLAALSVWAAPSSANLGANLAGRVVDRSQKAIPQATVFIYTAKPRVGPGILCPSCYVDCRKKAMTDAEGKFLIAGLSSELIFRVLVVAEGFRPQLVPNVDPAKAPLNVKLEAMPSDLSRRAVLRGRVFDGSGKPIVGAVISPFFCERADRRFGGRMPGVDPASVTNLRGEFLITGNPGDLGYGIEVEAAGFSKKNVELLPTGGKVHEIRLTEGATVRGRILNKDKPVPGIAVGLVQCDASAGRFVGAYHIATDRQGRYTFLNVHPSDEYFVFTTMGGTVRFGGILPIRRITVGADGTSKDAGDGRLEATFHTVAGRVILTDGKPVPKGMQLMLSREDLGTWDSQTKKLAADGSFRFAGVPKEAVSLNGRIPGYRLASKRNRFQQVHPWAVALMVDADKLGLELFFEPETVK